MLFRHSLSVLSVLSASATLCLSSCAAPQASKSTAPKAGAKVVTRPDPARFAKDIAKFRAEDRANPPGTGKIVFTGSSSVRLWDVKKAFPELPVLNRGFGGSVANDLNVYAHEVALKHQPKVLLVYTGSNDLNRGLTPEQVFHDYTRFLNKVHHHSPQTVVIVNSIKIARSRLKDIPHVERTNEMLAAWCAKRRWTVWLESAGYLKDEKGQPVDKYFRKDKLHLSDEGYVQWNAIVGPVLREQWAKPSRHYQKDFSTRAFRRPRF